MKNFLLLIFMLGMFSFASGQRLHYEDWGLDTLTDAGTVTLTVANQFDAYGSYGFYCVADSLSGATDGSVSYQVSVADGDPYIEIATATIDGVQTILKQEGVLYGQKFRIVITGTGTQSTKLSPIFVFKAHDR